MGKITGIVLTVVVVYVSYITYESLKDGIAPNIPDEYWGISSSSEGKKSAEDSSIRPFKIEVDEKMLSDLKNRLKVELSLDGETTRNRFVKPLEGIGFEYGFNTNFVKKVGQYWFEKYDYKERVKGLNMFPQFKTQISGLDIHFLQVKSNNNNKYKTTLPILMVHGWPGSYLGFYKVIPLLLDPPQGSDINFELTIPSIPGYGFSEASHRPGFGALQTAQLFHKLMQRLNFQKYYIQGGDWVLKDLEKDEIERSNNFGLQLREAGYMHIQATKPDTIGPTGLAAYILEKFSGWTNLEWISKKDGGLIPHFKLDELLDNVMIYWVTNSITTSMRFYAENLSLKAFQDGMNRVPVTVPSACLNVPNEFFFSSRITLTDKYPNLIRYTNAKKGGHFAAFEVPEILAEDLIAFVKQVEKLPFAD